jgi:hypothetical protein
VVVLFRGDLRLGELGLELGHLGVEFSDLLVAIQDLLDEGGRAVVLLVLDAEFEQGALVWRELNDRGVGLQAGLGHGLGLDLGDGPRLAFSLLGLCDLCDQVLGFRGFGLCLLAATYGKSEGRESKGRTECNGSQDLHRTS